MSYKLKLNIDALIFSIDDVLVDISMSYREVVRKTTQLYLEQAIGLPPTKESLLSSEEVMLLQKVGNFSNYWDLMTAFIMYFCEMLPPVPIPTFPSKLHVPAIMAYLQLAGGRLRTTIETLREQKNIDKLAQDVAAAGGGVEGANKALPRMNRHLLVASGDIIKTNLAGRIFQELYLGASLFEKIYQQPAVIVQSTGYIEHESLLINREVLEEISQKIAIGVVSSRPRLEVEHSLSIRNIKQYFRSIVSLDDIKEAKGKPLPDPWALLEAVQRIQPTPTHSAYIGSTPGDIQAARDANQTMPFQAIGCLAGAHNKAEMRKLFEQNKASVILGHPDNLRELIPD